MNCPSSLLRVILTISRWIAISGDDAIISLIFYESSFDPLFASAFPQIVGFKESKRGSVNSVQCSPVAVVSYTVLSSKNLPYNWDDLTSGHIY